MDILRRSLLKLALPSTLLTLFCSGKAKANINDGIETGPISNVVRPVSTPESAGVTGKGDGVDEASLRLDLISSDGSMLGYKNAGNHAAMQTVKEKLDRIFYVSDFGVLNENSPPVNTVNLQRMLNDISGKDEVTRIVFADVGTLYLNGPIVIPDNTDIEIKVGVTISGATGNVKPIFVSEFWSYVLSKRTINDGVVNNTADIGIRSHYIGLWGAGAVDYNYTGGSADSGMDMSCICIASAMQVKLGGGLMISGAIKYSWLVANVQRLDVQGLRFNNRSDGLHLQPPIDYAYVRNLSGTTGDDMFAMTGGDYLDYDIGLRGAFNHIDVNGIHGENSLCAVKIAGNKTTPINHLSVDGIYGTFSTSVFRIWSDTQNLDFTRVKTCNLDNIGAMPGSGYRAIEIKTVGTGTVNVDNLIVGAISGNYAKCTVPVISVTTGTASNAAVRIHKLTCRCPRNVAYFFEVGGDGAGADASRIDNLEVTFDAAILRPDAPEAYGVKVTRGQINNLVITGSISLAAGQSVLRTSGGKISLVTFDKLNQVNGYTCRATKGNFDASIPEFKFIGGLYTSPEKLVSLVTGYSIDTAGPTVVSKTGEIFTTTAGLVNVQGQVIYGNSCIPVDPVVGVTWSVRGFGINADVRNISAVRGGHCYNTNPSLAGGIGPSAANGSSWQSVI
ncbi:hypothetical protein [Pantoea coffeiphila]|nr:hypothetical protein [Pantoea coffeiphila]